MAGLLSGAGATEAGAKRGGAQVAGAGTGEVGDGLVEAFILTFTNARSSHKAARYKNALPTLWDRGDS